MSPEKQNKCGLQQGNGARGKEERGGTLGDYWWKQASNSLEAKMR